MTGPGLRVVLLVGGAGAVVVLVGVFGLVGALAGLAAMAAATVLTRRSATASAVSDLDWWRLLGGGTALVALGIGVGFGLESLGGLLAALGAALAVIAVALALP